MSDDKAPTTTIRLTISDRDDNIGQLQRALDLAKDLQEAGLQVRLTGDVYITARADIRPPFLPDEPS